MTFNGDQARLHRWQDGQLQSQDIGMSVGGWVEWWLCRDTETNELGIEWRVNGGGAFDGGTSTFYYFSRETSISDQRSLMEGAETDWTVDSRKVTQAEYDAIRAQNQRVEELIVQAGSRERVKQAWAALDAMCGG